MCVCSVSLVSWSESRGVCKLLPALQKIILFCRFILYLYLLIKKIIFSFQLFSPAPQRRKEQTVLRDLAPHSFFDRPRCFHLLVYFERVRASFNLVFRPFSIRNKIQDTPKPGFGRTVILWGEGSLSRRSFPRPP